MKNEFVKDWMTRDVVIIPSRTSLHEAQKLMKDYRIRRLPVVDDGELVGIVTWGDIRGARPSVATTLSVGEINYLLDKTTVRHIMTRRPVTIAQTATAGEAAQVMLAKKISVLPVVDMAGNVIGIITESDIFRLAVRYWTAAQAEEPQDSVPSPLPAISPVEATSSIPELA